MYRRLGESQPAAPARPVSDAPSKVDAGHPNEPIAPEEAVRRADAAHQEAEKAILLCEQARTRLKNARTRLDEAQEKLPDLEGVYRNLSRRAEGLKRAAQGAGDEYQRLQSLANRAGSANHPELAEKLAAAHQKAREAKTAEKDQYIALINLNNARAQISGVDKELHTALEEYTKWNAASGKALDARDKYLRLNKSQPAPPRPMPPRPSTAAAGDRVSAIQRNGQGTPGPGAVPTPVRP